MFKNKKMKKFLAIVGIAIAFVGLASWVWLMACQLTGMLQPCYSDNMVYNILNFITGCGDANYIPCRQ